MEQIWVSERFRSRLRLAWLMTPRAPPRPGLSDCTVSSYPGRWSANLPALVQGFKEVILPFTHWFILPFTHWFSHLDFFRAPSKAAGLKATSSTLSPPPNPETCDYFIPHPLSRYLSNPESHSHAHYEKYGLSPSYYQNIFIALFVSKNWWEYQFVCLTNNVRRMVEGGK